MKKYWLILLIVGIAIFSVFNVTNGAVENTVVVKFNQEALQKGFPVTSFDQQFCVPVFPRQFDQLTMKISEVTKESLLPQNRKAISGYYLHDLKPGYQGVLKKATLLSFNIPNLAQYEKPAIYFYDQHWQQWRELKTKVDLENNRVQAQTIFPYAKVAVLAVGEEPAEAVAPVSLEDSLTAQSAIVIDKNSGQTVFSKNQDEVRPVASLTKLVVALTFLDHNPGWDKVVIMQKSDFVGGATLYVKEGDQLTVHDLFKATMIGSKNNTTKALMRSTGFSDAEFVSLMNQKVQSLGLKNSHFVEPTGLDERNLSTARDMAIIARTAFNNFDVLQATTTKSYRIKPQNSDLYYWVQNTSLKVLERDLYVTGTKTGWTDEAGYCLVSQAKKDGNELLALVLGAKIRQNYEEVYALLKKYL